MTAPTDDPHLEDDGWGGETLLARGFHWIINSGPLPPTLAKPPLG